MSDSGDGAAPKHDDEQVIIDQPQNLTRDEKDEQRAVADYSDDAKNAPLSMQVKVHSPFKDYFEGMAFSISAENATGPFDILPRHHNFISLLTPCEMIIRTVKSGEQRIKISGGIMHVKADKVIVFLDI